MGKNHRIAKLGLAGYLMVVALVFMLGNWNETKAGDNGTLDYQVVHTYDEMIDYLSGDDSFYSFWGEPIKIGDSWSNLEKIFVDESWTVEITEPGWLIIYDYNNYPTTNSYYKSSDATFSYLYSNKLRTKPVNRVDASSNYVSLTSKLFNNRNVERYYVTEGTYYLTYSGNKVYYSNCLLCAVFLPAKDLLDVKEIKYNADYSEVVVTFNASPDSYTYIAYTDQKITSGDALGDKNQWKTWRDKSSTYYYTDENGSHNESGANGINLKRFLENGWKITTNGEYSVYCKIASGAFSGYEAIVNFKISDIGKNVKVKSLKMSKSKASMKKGEILSLKVTIKPSDATDRAITWKSSNPKVARVDENGNVTAVKKGTCTITAASSNGKKAKCKISVK